MDEFQATGGTFTKLFNIQSKRFTTISCTRCHYTEIYKTKSSQFGNVVDFFFN
jgi:predicted nucleic-acid-binding Zn-ribbon protein